MGIAIELKVTKGERIGETHSFSSPCSVYVGRHSECSIILPEATVSRYHCILDIVPPAIKVRDFGSLNGTYVNSILIGKRNKDQSLEEAKKDVGVLINLHDGDKLRLGNACELEVAIKSDLFCCKCKKTVGLVPNDFLLIDDTHIVCPECKARHDQEQKIKLAQRVISPENKANQNDLFPGYKTIRRLGHGGMGEVWLATSNKDGKNYAIKRMLPKLAAIPHSRESFLREASLANQLSHQNIVTQYSFHQSEKEVFLVMEYCNNGSVEDLLRASEKPFPVLDALDCIIQVLEGLSYAHSAVIKTKLPNGETKSSIGLVHRDFKPSNIFVQKEDGKTIYKVADFGLAKAFEIAGLSGHTRAGQVAGTPVFMPRQQVVDFMYAKPEVDVWAAAASLYYMLTGYPPKYSDKKDPWLVAVIEKAIPIRKRNPNVPKELASIIDKALIDNPTISFTNAKALQNELKRVYKELL